MTQIEQEILKYRILFFAGWLSMITSVIYAFYYQTWFLLIGSYLWSRFLGVFGLQITLHRYFSHSAFKTNKPIRRILIWLSVLSGQGSPISWSTHHRHHHKHSDTKLDLHSPHQLTLSEMLRWHAWPSAHYLESKELKPSVRDLLRDKEVMFVHANYFRIWACMVVVAFLISWQFCWFFVLSPVGWTMFHALLGNFTGHWRLPGSYRNHDTDDESYNHRWLSLYFMGEGLHNNHHHRPNDYNQALRPGELDIAGWIVRKFLAKTSG